MMRLPGILSAIGALGFSIAMTTVGFAEDLLKVAVSQRGNWEQSVCELGTNSGIFAKHGLKLEVLYTAASGETMQAVIPGAVDIGIGIGTTAAIGAYTKGAPIRAIGSQTIGSDEVFWYVPSNSSIKGFADAIDKSVAFSTKGSSTYEMAVALTERFNVNANLVATGAIPATFTQVMTGQVDVGYSVPPFGLADIQEGRIRVIAKGSDIPKFKGQSVRLIAANAGKLDENREVFRRFLDAYLETLDWMYAGDDAIKAYATWAGVSEEIAKQTREFYPKEALLPNQIKGLEAVMADGVKRKQFDKPLTDAQIKEFVQFAEPAR